MLLFSNIYIKATQMYFFNKLTFFIVISVLFTLGCVRSSRGGGMAPAHGMQPHMTPAHSMHQVNHQSANVQPHMISSYPANAKIGNATFIDLTQEKFKILNYINSVRARGNECGEPSQPLGWNRELATAAKAHARDMAANGFLGHMGSGTALDEAKKAPGQGSNFYERILYYGYPIKAGQLAGEIISYTKFNIVGNEETYPHLVHAINNFLKSPTHCGLLMNSRFHDAGVAAYKDQEKIYWVIEFGELSY